VGGCVLCLASARVRTQHRSCCYGLLWSAMGVPNAAVACRFPLGLLFSDSGAHLVVADSDNQRIALYDTTTGAHVGNLADEADGLLEPFALCPYDGGIAVADPSVGRVVHLAWDGHTTTKAAAVSALCGKGVGDDGPQMKGPTGVDVLPGLVGGGLLVRDRDLRQVWLCTTMDMGCPGEGLCLGPEKGAVQGDEGHPAKVRAWLAVCVPRLSAPGAQPQPRDCLHMHTHPVGGRQKRQPTSRRWTAPA
jgi:hypothetical protein